jgi:hypothetical protein
MSFKFEWWNSEKNRGWQSLFWNHFSRYFVTPVNFIHWNMEVCVRLKDMVAIVNGGGAKKREPIAFEFARNA